LRKALFQLHICSQNFAQRKARSGVSLPSRSAQFIQDGVNTMPWEPFAMRTSLSAVAAILAMAGLAGPAVSQGLSYLPRRLTSSDMEILRTESAKLRLQGPKEDAWHNPASGHSGTVTLLSTKTEQGLPCRKFRYIFYTGTPQDGSPYTLTWCRTSTGRLAIAP
jgi:hypothetical protein